MLIDQNSVFFDDATAAASMTSKVIGLMPYAGREDAGNITFTARGANTSPVTFTVNVEESADKAAFATVGVFTVEKTGSAPAMQTLSLPASVKERFVRLSVTATGGTAGLTVFAGLTQEDFAPYDKGLFINAGKVVA